MDKIYNFSLFTYDSLMSLAAFFHPKAKLWVQGRKIQEERIRNFKPTKNHPVFWFHSASLGEFEQGRPVIEKLKQQHPNISIVLSFFSPSGYEIRKNYAHADLVVYLPLDRPKKVQNFIDHIQPTHAIFIKYEIWPNYFNELKRRGIPLFLISAIFRENQRFFKSNAKKWFAKPLHQVTRFFVQNEASKTLLSSIEINAVDVVGDTRFDRVLEIVETNVHIPEIEKFTDNKITFILGSSWEEDEKMLANFLETTDKDFKTIIAPHEIHASRISSLQKLFGHDSILFSSLNQEKVEDKKILILDNMGMLSKAYGSANIAMIGGGFGKGIHNTLEAAAYGIPLVFGPNYQKFQEAKDLLEIGAAQVVSQQDEFNQNLSSLLSDENTRISKGKLAKKYVENNRGATDIIVRALLEN